jgi:DNA-binding transcriptional regulator/RsmH inhibitor MraZ
MGAMTCESNLRIYTRSAGLPSHVKYNPTPSAYLQGRITHFQIWKNGEFQKYVLNEHKNETQIELT